MNQGKAAILFVDDEENVLLGLKRMMRPKRKEWDTLFANSGDEALSLLKETHVDVIVTDMRMPGMDGAELLNRVQDDYPETIRIVLSGFAEKEVILKTVGPSHQYLAKPCNQDILINTIQRSLKLRALLYADALRTVVAGMKHVPAVPKIFQAILTELDDQYASAESLADLVSQDVSLTAHLIKLTNSAYFGLPISASTPKQAISFLGFENVKAVVLLGGLFEQFKGNEMSLGMLETLNRRSTQLGVLSRAIAEAIGLAPEEQEQAFCAGLVGHMGTLLLAANWPEKFRDVISLIEQNSYSISRAELEVFGTTHGALGAYLLGLWGFNDSIVEAVAYHHYPNECSDSSQGVLLSMHVAQHLLRVKRNASLEETSVNQSLDKDYLAKVGNKSSMKQWEMVYEEVSKEWPDD